MTIKSCFSLIEEAKQKIKSINFKNAMKLHNEGETIFIDLRDHFGLTQCVIENKNKSFKSLERIKPESVISVTGKVIKREKGTENIDF